MNGAAPRAMRIRPMSDDDWPRVREIYLEGIATRQATFETAAPTWEAWDTAHRRDCRLVAEDSAGSVVGWVALTPYSSRTAYAGVADLSVYVAAPARGHGVGRTLLAALIDASEAAGIWTLQAGVNHGNDASLRLHEAAGFRIVGVRERIGRLDAEWRDVILLERRSSIVGTT